MSRIPVLTPQELRAVETRAAGWSPSLMERAGRATAMTARLLAKDTGEPVLVVAGPGNNGGDAWVAAAHLRESFHRVVVLDAGGGTPKAAEARAAKSEFTARGGEIVREWPDALAPALVIDGLLGIGLVREVAPPFSGLIERMNASYAPILAIDVPSGLDAHTGIVRGVAVRATRTLTFLSHKAGLHTGDGLDHCGIVELDDLGAPDEALVEASGSLLTPATVRGWLRPRRRNAHKGDFGTLAIVGGNRGMVGAALLAARAGLFCGAGKVVVGLLSPEAPAVDPMHPELMLRPVDDALGADVLVVGPGAGRSPSASSMSAFERATLPATLALAKPLVLDADALNAIAFNESLQRMLSARKSPTLLTPHPAEAARLLGKGTADIQADRPASALALAQRYRAGVVLKGAGSICAFPDGRWSVNATGNAGLASGGTGDVLAGMAGALLAQGIAPEQALQLAVCLHGAAADAAAGEGRGPIGLTASEVTLEARRLMNAWVAR
ncbi:MAG TPA: NAD(P)H-hydrate dehydratase [Usitatibacter sp.]|nr:NAD(P)H-hydrate dehydratase [Usitatibacter sp.]